MRLAATTLVGFLFASSLPASAQVDPCIKPFLSGSIAGAASLADVRPQRFNPLLPPPSAFKDIADSVFEAAGYPAGYFKVQSTDRVLNACAARTDNGGQILVNTEWLERFSGGDSWAAIGVLAHELGHLQLGHTSFAAATDPHSIEGEADEFAGRTMALMGATLQQAQSAFQRFSEESSRSHPSRAIRLRHVEIGFERGRKTLTQRSDSNASFIQQLSDLVAPMARLRAVPSFLCQTLSAKENTQCVSLREYNSMLFNDPPPWQQNIFPGGQRQFVFDRLCKRKDLGRAQYARVEVPDLGPIFTYTCGARVS